jgi:hypothetical protein
VLSFGPISMFQCFLWMFSTVSPLCQGGSSAFAYRSKSGTAIAAPAAATARMLTSTAQLRWTISLPRLLTDFVVMS